MNRREFLQGLVALAAAGAIPKPLLAAVEKQTADTTSSDEEKQIKDRCFFFWSEPRGKRTYGEELQPPQVIAYGCSYWKDGHWHHSVVEWDRPVLWHTEHVCHQAAKRKVQRIARMYA